MSNLTQTQKNLRGIVAMMLAMGFFVLNDTLVKLARQTFDAGQIMAVRGVMASAMLVVWLAASRNLGNIRFIAHPGLIARGLTESFIATTFIIALGMMPLADITAILLMAPFIITALSTIFFSEKVGWRRWSAVAVGFLGMLFVVRPGSGAVAPLPLVLAFVAVVGVGFRDTLTCRIPAGIPSTTVALTSTLGTIIAGSGIIFAGGGWQPVTTDFFLLCLGAAFFVVCGNYAIIEACRDVELSVVSGFRYVVILWAVLLGIIVFDEWPQPAALGGILLIVASGLYTLHRERVRGAQR